MDLDSFHICHQPERRSALGESGKAALRPPRGLLKTMKYLQYGMWVYVLCSIKREFWIFGFLWYVLQFKFLTWIWLPMSWFINFLAKPNEAHVSSIGLRGVFHRWWFFFLAPLFMSFSPWELCNFSPDFITLQHWEQLGWQNHFNFRFFSPWSWV